MTIKGKDALVELNNGQYTVIITENPQKIKQFEFSAGKKLTMIGDYYTDLFTLLDKMDNEKFSTEIKNTTIAKFNEVYIGKYFDVKLQLNVTNDLVIKKQLIPNIALDVPYILENGAVNVENAFDFMLQSWSLQPLMINGYTKPIQWNTAPNPLKVYIETEISGDKKFDYTKITVDTLHLLEEKAGMQFYEFVDSIAKSQISINFDVNAPISKTTFDTIITEPITGDPYIYKSSVIIVPNGILSEISTMIEQQAFYCNTGIIQLNIKNTIGNGSSKYITKAEKFISILAFRLYKDFNTVEHLVQ